MKAHYFLGAHEGGLLPLALYRTNAEVKPEEKLQAWNVSSTEPRFESVTVVAVLTEAGRTAAAFADHSAEQLDMPIFRDGLREIMEALQMVDALRKAESLLALQQQHAAKLTQYGVPSE